MNFAERQRGLAVGLYMTGTKIGPAIGAPLAAWLILHRDWKTMFVAVGLGGLIWLFPWLLLVKDGGRAPAQSGGAVAVREDHFKLSAKFTGAGSEGAAGADQGEVTRRLSSCGYSARAKWDKSVTPSGIPRGVSNNEQRTLGLEMPRGYARHDISLRDHKSSWACRTQSGSRLFISTRSGFSLADQSINRS